MRKNRTLRVAALLLALTLITSCFVGGTFAKYTASGNISAQNATVAKWSVKVGGADIAKSETISINLFDTTKTYEHNGTDEDDDVTAGKIAPGTGGKFENEIENASEVTAKYSIEYTVEAGSIPLQFKVGNGSYGTLEDVTDVEIDIGATETITVYWMWDFDSAETVDNPLGTATPAPTASISAVVNVEQVD